MLGPLTHQLIAHTCPAALQAEISSLLETSCSEALPGVGRSPEWEALIDRVQLAAIRGSGWQIERIRKSVALANVDWRDLLVGAGFGSDLSAHKHWQANALETRDIS